jgi:Na+-transporting NADH:ubiquinone oxidoreductase subunit NqrC
MKKQVLLIGILVLIVFGLSLVRIYISNQVATSGVMLSQIQQQVDAYKMQNMLLAENLYTKSSLTNIAQEASNEGYVEQKTDFVLNGQAPVAYKQ